MDNVNLRKKVGISSAFALSLVLIAVLFALGAVAAVLLREQAAESIMSIRQTARISVWLSLAALLFADAACLVMPAACVLSVLFSAIFGALMTFVSYLYSDLKLFSTGFFMFAAVVFSFAVAVTYVSDRVFTLSPKLRTFIRGDRRLLRELNVFNAVSAALVLAAVISAALLIL